MKEGKKIKILVNYRFHKAGHIGMIDEVLSENEASVNMEWNNPNKAKSIIFIHMKHKGELWDFVD
ncbi:hypothetical protein [Bacillus smithii]|uniref:hypothetical protein n=1 Tax=Bacillus smithii TaxID=1479 RepID=UPI002E21B5BA|nr:hypothetical protein [Bacillus smithii]MED4929176.1 hypothetical protein [Bacillus smithii]